MAVGDRRISRLRWIKLAVLLSSAIGAFLLLAYFYLGEMLSLIACVRIWLLGVALTVVAFELAFRGHEGRLKCQPRKGISRRQMTERALNGGRSQLPGLAGKVPALVFATDRVGHIAMFPGQGLESLTPTVDDPLGQRYWDVLPGSPELADVTGEEPYFQAPIENTSDILVVIGGDAIIRYGNPVAEQLLGDKPGWTAGQDLIESIHVAGLDEFGSIVARLLQGHTNRSTSGSACRMATVTTA